MAVLKVEDLFLHYRTRRGAVRAVDGITFEMQPGELVGYLGPNGAGKSTTIKMLTGLLVPSAGELRVNGFVPWKERQAYVARIGAVFGHEAVTDCGAIVLNLANPGDWVSPGSNHNRSAGKPRDLYFNRL